MSSSHAKRVRRWLGQPRRLLVVASVAVFAVVISTTITHAAWTDNEWAHGAVGVSNPGDCTTNTMFMNQAWGRQLTGTVANIALDSLVGVNGVKAANDGTTTVPTPNDNTVTKVDATTYIAKLPVGILNSTIIAPALGLGLPVGGIGAYTQWSQAQPNGKAHGASGLVSDQSGAVDVAGTANGKVEGPDAAVINLEKLVPAALAGLSLNVGAVASSAEVDACQMVNGWPQVSAAPNVTREYGIAGVDLTATVPAVGALSTGAANLVGAVPGTLTALGGTTGDVSTGISGGLFTLLSPVVKLLSTALSPLSLGSFSTEAIIEKLDVSGIQALLKKPIADSEGVLAVDFSLGTVRIDISSLVGGEYGLNNLNANHEVILDDAIVNTLISKLTALLDEWKGKVMDALLLAVRSVKLHFTSKSTVKLLVVPIASIDVEAGPATLGQFLDGTAPVPKVSVKLLGALDAPLVNNLTTALLGGTLGVVGNVLKATVFGANALVPALGVSLAALVTPVVTAVSPIVRTFRSLVSIRINVQPDKPWSGGAKPSDVTAPAGEYKVSAIRVGLVDFNSASLLSLSLANSSAGPAAVHP
ncbi:choice-of-anchor G family protein [Arthrobacter sp. GMC3]|uniref:choice-of-anchor G family protein n=1 Tax=Arthrobacter sp. GMC3 TaxID=2058894 RepID=UPI000CE4BB13|nr:choice-of-anchor G family protein [Arthrobacter sp. GMC3]